MLYLPVKRASSYQLREFAQAERGLEKIGRRARLSQCLP